MSRKQSTDVAQKFKEVDITCVFDDTDSRLDPEPFDHVSVELKSDAWTLRDDETALCDSVWLY